jgi:tetratricopeptide (TPR) repeat protein
MIYGWNWQPAEENLQRAIAADPNYPTGHQWYGDFLVGRGRLAEGLAEMSRAHQLDPLSRQIAAEWGWTSYLMHRYDEAESHIRQVLALDPNYAQAHYRLGLVEIQQRRYPEAVASLKRAIDLGAFFPQVAGVRVCAVGQSGRGTEDRERPGAACDTGVHPAGRDRDRVCRPRRRDTGARVAEPRHRRA